MDSIYTFPFRKFLLLMAEWKKPIFNSSLITLIVYLLAENFSLSPPNPSINEGSRNEARLAFRPGFAKISKFMTNFEMLSMPNPATGHIKLSSWTSDSNHNYFIAWMDSALCTNHSILRTQDRDNFSRQELMYLIKLRYSTFILTESWVYISTFLHSAVWQQIIHYSEKTRQDNELPDPDSGLCNFHENTSPSLNVSLSHCTNILYSLEFYTSSQPTMSTSTRTKNRTISF